MLSDVSHTFVLDIDNDEKEYIVVNTLRLVPELRSPYPGSLAILIDEVPLEDIFAEFESRYTVKINGAYTSLLTFNNLRNKIAKQKGGFVPLGCDCGEPECWFVTGEIVEVDNYICWMNWENPYREAWKYNDFPSIVFEKAQYAHAIEHALTLKK